MADGEAKGAIKSVENRWRRIGRRARITIISIVVVLVVIRLAMPYAIKAYVNHQLNTSKDYTGSVGDIHVALIRGAYQIKDAKIMKRTGGVPVPFFSVKTMDLSIQWKELFHGAVVGKILLDTPQLNFVEGTNAADSQTGKNESWDKMLSSLFPFNFNRVQIDHGQIHFRNFNSTPPVDIYFNELAVVATNLTNARNLKQKLPSGVQAKATTLGGGLLDFDLQLNALANPPAYELNAGLTNVALTNLNGFLRAYGKFDVERGQFAAFTSVASADGQYEGYIKIFFDDLDVFAWEKERKKNILQIFWQAIVGAATTVFKNHSEDRLATRVPISGSYQGSSVGLWTAVGTLMENAFIRALLLKLDESMTVEKVETDQGKPEPKPTP